MNRIKNSKQLAEEKKRLHEKQVQLQKEIYSAWLNLKDSVHPVELVKNAAREFSAKKEQASKTGNVLHETLSYVVSLVGDKVLSGLKKRLGRFFEEKEM
jgi:hypothetical protein